MTSYSDWRPATSGERFRTIDIIRGLALFGVLIVNILSGFRVPLLEHIRAPYSVSGGANHLVELIAAGALEFKAITIFSFLFGAGIAIQVERAASRNINPRGFLARRLAWLFVFGTAHMFLIWNGDILTLYAICGLLLLPFVGLPWPALLALGVALIALPEFVSFGLRLPSGPAAIAAIAQARRVYGGEGFLAILEFRWQEAWSLIVPVLISVLPRTAGLLCWGMAAWGSGILRAPDKHRKKLAAALAVGAAIGGPITINEVWAKSAGHAPWPMLHYTHIDASIPLALAYVSFLLLWLNPGRVSLLPGFAALGQMALTNYLLQSIVLGCIFYGYGFGLFGRIGSAAAAGIGLALYTAQAQLSRLWLRRFRFGPFEWLWRSLTYGRRQPMRHGAAGGIWERRLPRWLGMGFHAVAFPAACVLAPWALSLLAERHGWVAGKPGVWNLPGLILVAPGFYIFFSCMREHFIAAPDGWRLERTPHYPTPSYLLTEGPYRYSCNPMYLADLAIWLGWIAFYGSFVLGGVFAAAALLVGPVIVPREERGLEVRFGDVYREFRRTTPRWLGKTRR